MDIRKFFDKFVANYPLYQTDRGFTIIMDKFRDVFLKETYEIVPELFKSLYEKGEIPPEVYDQILIDCGVSQILINELSQIEKSIFIQSLADFQKYKATVGLVETVIKAYGDNFEAYELYVDYNLSRNRWECKPFPIYKPEHNDGYRGVIPYKIVYEKIPTLLIHETQLDLMRENNLAAFPLKTNIVFISSNYNQSIVSYIRNLIISVFYKTYREEEISLNFREETFKVDLYTFILTWLYVVFNKTSSKLLNDFLSQELIINFKEDNINITIEELDDIIEEYEQIGTRTISKIFNKTEIISSSMDEFYYKYFHVLKSEITQSDQVIDINTLRNMIKVENSSLIDYLDTFIGENVRAITILMGDLVNSIESHKNKTTDINFVKYFRFFKAFLPNVDFVPSQSTVYKILYYVKPFHTEFLDLEDLSMIYSDDKFNSVYFEIYYQNHLIPEHTDVVELEEHYYPKELDKNFSDIAVISALMGKFLRHINISNLEFFDEYYHMLIDYKSSNMEIEDDFILLFTPVNK